MNVSLALIQGHCRQSKPRPNPIPAGCAGHPGKNKRVIWMVARQHPGEAMAEWFVEGFLDRLTDPHDGASMRVLEHAVFYVVGVTSRAYRSLLYCMLHAAGIASYHTGNGQLVDSCLKHSLGLLCCCLHACSTGLWHATDHPESMACLLCPTCITSSAWKGAISFSPIVRIRLSLDPRKLYAPPLKLCNCCVQRCQTRTLRASQESVTAVCRCPI